MAQLRRGYTFQDGSTGNSSNLHQLVDGGGILPGAISEQASAAPADADNFLFNKGGILKKCSLSAIKATIPAGAAADVFALRKLGTDALMACAGNDTRLRNAITGVRFGQGTGIDRVAIPPDFSYRPARPSGTDHTVIDWDVADVFWDRLTANKTYTFSNVKVGRRVLLVVEHNGHIVTFPTLYGGQPLLTPSTGNTRYVVELTFVPEFGLPTAYRLDPIPSEDDPNPVNLGNGTVINWDQGRVFYASPTADKTYTFNNVLDGQAVKVIVKTNGHAITWPSLLNREPNIDQGDNNTFVFEFVKTPLGFSGYLLNEELASVYVSGVSGTDVNIDWSLGPVFYDGLTADKTYTFSNATDGMSIQLIVQRNGHAPTLPGTANVVTVGAGSTFAHYFLTSTPVGITGLKIAI